MKNRAALVLVAVLVAACASTGQPTTSPTSPTSVPVTPSLPAETPTAADAAPIGSVPPVSTAAWSGLRLQAIKAGPLSASSVVAWSGGYLALGQPTGISPLTAWLSRDGRSWVQLPTDTFPVASGAQAAAGADGVLVATESPTGETTVSHSTDGVTWSSSPSARLALARQSGLVGSGRGTVAVLNDSPSRLVFTTDGVVWRPVVMPGASSFSARAVAPFGTGFVAVGDSGVGAKAPRAWWSEDGLNWTPAVVGTGPGATFFDVVAARDGLVAETTTEGVPGLTSFWTSSDGRTWEPSTADPLGVWPQGEGMGSANGGFSGDGTRVLATGIRAQGQPIELWASFDGTRWTKLVLAGAAAIVVAGQTAPFPMRDGVLFSGEHGAWFGAGVP